MHTETPNPQNSPAKLYQGKKGRRILCVLASVSNKPCFSYTETPCHMKTGPLVKHLRAAVAHSLAYASCLVSSNNARYDAKLIKTLI